VAGGAWALLAAGPAATAQVVYQGSAQYATGEYIFTQRTNSFYFFSGLSASFGPATVGMSVPLILQNTPWVSYGGGGMIASGGTEHDSVGGHVRGRGGRISLPDTASFAELAVGDPVGALDVKLWDERGVRPAVRAAAFAKAPLADVDRGFGTGEWDYGGGLSFAKTLGRLFLFADATYWVLGDLPALQLKDGVAYGGAVGVPLADLRWGLLASVSGSTRVVEGTDPPARIGVVLTRYLESERSVSVSGTLGVTESAPDLTLSVGWRLPLGRRGTAPNRTWDAGGGANRRGSRD
jgi:hypothetical protein